MEKVVVIGGGASGLVSAIFAARFGNKVKILEKNNICGKKILATGNGRCNFWNEEQSISHYRTSSDLKKIEEVLSEENKNQIQEFFKQIGIEPKIKNGYYYPFSNQAISMQNALVVEAEKLGIIIENNSVVENIEKVNDKFMISAQDKEKVYADKVILATGSKAAPKTGSDGIGYKICEKFNHTIIKPLPALVQLKTKGNFLKDWDGVRANVEIKLFENEEEMAVEKGEIQLTNYGISGICVFNLSGRIARGLDKKKKEEVEINFVEGLNLHTTEEFINWMDLRNNIVKNRNIKELLEGILNYKLLNVILKQSNIKNEDNWSKISYEQKQRLAENIVGFKLEIIGTNSFDKAQVCSGGICLDEIDTKNMESKCVKDLYITGELLDADGDCGGYNLEWAWVTGMLAGKNCG